MPVRCPVCQAPAARWLRGTTTPSAYFKQSHYAIAAGQRGDYLPVHRCRQCGHGFTPINGDANLVTQWYAANDVDHNFLGEEAGRRQTARHVLKNIHRLGPTAGRLLDVGSGPGFFLSEARTCGYQVTGLEPSAWAVAHAQKILRLPTIYPGDVRQLQHMPANSWQVITAFDVIEHLVNPEELVADAARVLTPGGLLVLTTPRFDSLLARVMGRKWYCIFPAHLHYFSWPSLSKLLASHGFTVVWRRSHTRYLSRNYLWRRLLDYLHLQPLAGQTNQPSHRSVPINFGDEFEIYARRRTVSPAPREER